MSGSAGIDRGGQGEQVSDQPPQLDEDVARADLHTSEQARGASQPSTFAAHGQESAQPTIQRGKKRGSMIYFQVAEGHQRKKKNVFAPHERRKVRISVLHEDSLRQKNPEKYSDHDARDEALVTKWSKRFSHVSEAVMRLEFAKIRREEELKRLKPSRADKEMALKRKYRGSVDKLRAMKERLSSTKEALAKATSDQKQVASLITEKQDLERRLSEAQELAGQVVRGAVQESNKKLEDLAEQHSETMRKFEKNTETVRTLEAQLKATTDELESARTDATKVQDLQREKTFVEEQLLKLQQESDAALEKAKKWDEERTRALAQTIREKEKLATRVRELENSPMENESLRAAKQELHELARQNQALRERLSTLGAMDPVLKEIERFRYVIDIGVAIENDLKNLQSALHFALCKFLPDAARLYYGSRLKAKSLTQTGLIDLAVALRKSVLGCGSQGVVDFRKTLCDWRTMRNDVSHNQGAYVPYARSDKFDEMKAGMDVARGLLDELLRILRNPRDASDRLTFLKNAVSVLVPDEPRH